MSGNETKTRLRAFVLGCAAYLASIACGQSTSVRPGINDSFKAPVVAEFVERFEKEGREVFDLRHEIIRACEIRPGMTVADIGAGTGLFTRLIAQEVGPAGSVIAVDIAENFVEHVITTSRAAGLTNVQGVLCSSTSCNLAPQSIDIAFICDVYHHFEFPHKSMRSIHRALKPGGVVVLVDFARIEGKSSAFILGHVRADEATFVRETIEAGFEKISRLEGLFEESYLVRFRKVEDVRVQKLDGDPNSPVDVFRIESSFQSAPTQLTVVRPKSVAISTRPDTGTSSRCPVVYLLPVESNSEHRYGSPVEEAIKLDLANQHRAIVVVPTFAALPWYADHPSDAKLQQERYILDAVVPFIDETYPTIAEPSGRALVGFSKSGWGAFTLAIRHPDVFGRAAAWDAPLMMNWPSRYGSAPIFGTEERFREYCLADLIEKLPSSKATLPRLVLAGHANFGDDHVELHHRLTKLSVPHVYHDQKQSDHRWDSNWLSQATTAVLAND